jgi:hypothetical protein
MTTTINVPEDLIELELARRDRKTEHDAWAAQHGHDGCRYSLYRAEQAIAKHPWLVERKTDWRAARKALKQAADAVSH